MRALYSKLMNFAIFGILLPFVYGCQLGGGDGSSGLSFLGSSAGGGDSSGIVGAQIATVHHPEPATMLLLGSGLAAISFYRKKIKSP